MLNKENLGRISENHKNGTKLFIILPLLFRCPVVSDPLQPHELQHARPPFPSQSPRVCPSSSSLHRGCHPATSDACFSFCPQCFPAPGTFPMSRLFTSNDQNTEASASATVLPVVLPNIKMAEFLLIFPPVH